MQRQRYRLYRRKNGNYYAHENATGKQSSLKTKDKGEAKGLLAAQNQAASQPILNIAMAKAYLSAKSPELLTRTWGELIQLISAMSPTNALPISGEVIPDDRWQ
jgi:hypothetical protein